MFSWVVCEVEFIVVVCIRFVLVMMVEFESMVFLGVLGMGLFLLVSSVLFMFRLFEMRILLFMGIWLLWCSIMMLFCMICVIGRGMCVLFWMMMMLFWCSSVIWFSFCLVEYFWIMLIIMLVMAVSENSRFS